jgi:DNA-binding transcriptional LysR family regulator
MSQPAMSRALARLRRLFGDELLVRGPAGTMPTARALALAEALPAVLDDVARLVRPPQFAPATARESFVIATVDYVSMVLLPGVLSRLRREAPGIALDIRSVGGAATEEALAAGRIDLLIGAEPDIGGSGLLRQRLFDDGYACLLPRGVARDHKALTLDAYLALPHALVTITGRGGGPVDRALERSARSRRVALRVQPFLAAPWMIAESDLAITLPRRLALRIAEPAGLAVREVPLDLGRLALVQVWHARRHKDPAHAWLRETIAAAAKALDQGPRAKKERERARRVR